MPLFRQNVLARLDRLHGRVDVSPRVSWQLVGGFIAASTLVAALFLSFASYGAYVDARGTITSTAGLVTVSSPRPALVANVLVAEGQRVRRGQPLVRLSHATVSDGGTLESRRAGAIEAQSRALADRAPRLAEASASRVRALRVTVDGEQRAQGRLVQQIEQQNALIASSVDDLARIKDVADRGYISGNDIRRRQELLAQRRQELARLQQEMEGSRTRAAAAEADIAKERDDLSLGLNDLAGNRADLGARAAADENATSTTLVAAADGIVSGLDVHPGDQVDASRPLMTLLPAGGRLQATLSLPAAKAAGIVEGQPVRIAVDAYPYQSFGTVSGRLASFSAAAVRTAGTEPAFLARVDLYASSVSAYGAAQPLRPGMTVSARVRTRTRSLIGVIFDPILAATRR